MSADPTAPESDVMPGDGEPTKEIERRVEQHVQVMPLMSDGEIRRTWRLASALAASRMFKDATQAEQAFGKILLGRDLGLSPTQSLTGIHLVEGKPEIAAVTLASFVRRREDCRYEIVEQRNEACEIHFFHVYRPGGDVQALVHSEVCPLGALEMTPPHAPREGCTCRPSHLHDGEELLGSSRFTDDDMKRAQLDRPTKNGAPSNHTKYPRNMKFARSMSNGIKWFCPEATGGIPVYHEGEIERDQVPAATSSAPVEMPQVLADLITRVHAVDSTAYRRNEVIARLPHPAAPEFVPTVDGIAAEIQTWLREHEPADAEVVPDEQPSQSLEDVEGGAQPATDAEATEEESGVETVDVAAGLQRRWETDPDWRLQVEVLLSRQADLEAAMDESADDEEPRRYEEHKAELEKVEADMDALGVASGWYPASAEQTSLGV